MQVVDSCVSVDNHWRDNFLEIMAMVHYLIHALQSFSTYEWEPLGAFIVAEGPSHPYSKSIMRN